MRRKRILCGLDNIDLVATRLTGKRVGLMTHPCAMNAHFQSAIDVIKARFSLTALIACEHGIRGDRQAGAAIADTVDPETGVPVFSAYGASGRIPASAFAALDALVIDLQDAGSRYYTYLYSMGYALEDCAKRGVPVVVLDRPNPLGGERVQGTLLDERFHSFIGEYAVPTRYALTIGEFARFVVRHRGLDCDLTICPMLGWGRGDYLDDLDIPWTPPSPNLPTATSALFYPGTCLFEGTNLSEGRGTTTPFELVGAPFLDAATLARRMNARGIPGVYYRPVSFVPTFSKHSNALCHGVQLHVDGRDLLDPFAAGLLLLDEIRRLAPEDFRFLPAIDLLLGGDDYRLGRLDGRGLMEKHAPRLRDFARNKEEFHLYP